MWILLVQSALVNKLLLAVAPHKRIGSELEETTDTSDNIKDYLQLMMQLTSDHSWLYKCFIEKSYYTIHRSSRFWQVRIWTNLTIEQVMMKSLRVVD